IEGIGEAAGGTVEPTPSRGGTPLPVVFVPRRRGGSPAAVATPQTGSGLREG
ncbi:MAG: hypothetical protein IRZ31_15495, partial [Thermogemmatispora sp.]|nr:hypothetical protein [Thermogemmatispora sp.]